MTWAPARVAMETPFSVPPTPSGAPNSLIRTPLTGIGSRPRGEAKATAGASRPGSLRAARSIRLSLVVGGAVRRRARRGWRVSRPCSSLPIKSLRLSTWRARSAALRAARPRAPFRSRPAFSAAPRSARSMRCALARRARRHRARSRSVSSAISLRTSQQVGEIGGQRLGLHAHVRQHGAEHDGGAHRLQRVLGPDHQRRRRMVADALQRRQHLGDGGAAAVERFADARARCRRAA